METTRRGFFGTVIGIFGAGLGVLSGRLTPYWAPYLYEPYIPLHVSKVPDLLMPIRREVNYVEMAHKLIDVQEIPNPAEVKR